MTKIKPVEIELDVQLDQNWENLYSQIYLSVLSQNFFITFPSQREEMKIGREITPLLKSFDKNQSGMFSRWALFWEGCWSV